MLPAYRFRTQSMGRPVWSNLLFLALLPVAFGQLAGDSPSVTIFNSSDTYHYHGCWDETTELANTTRLRALDGGIHMQLPETMTVPLCLDYCAKSTSTRYQYAGLEYSRECWCANELNSLSVRLPDEQCNTTCDGDAAMACGGALKLSVYQLVADGAGSAPPMMAKVSNNTVIHGQPLSIPDVCHTIPHIHELSSTNGHRLAAQSTVHLAVTILITTSAATGGAGECVVGVGKLIRIVNDGPHGDYERVGQLAEDGLALEVDDGLVTSTTDYGMDGIHDGYSESVFAPNASLVLLILSDVNDARHWNLTLQSWSGGAKASNGGSIKVVENCMSTCGVDTVGLIVLALRICRSW
ncbi:hypothetical protein DL766_010081 [Monosporascus sp. MC13-8B]|uniref:WSC domain-containing protein n=1 Tax=Monosporascus cannonballus TaxID=155416 RepID=A0ABY0H468_9PEZI|nr:hypothetical protein DL762_006942 [Monosporascus cannonballus]RYO92455.1 hypothetical protein DL763_004682 [Monosporascus cannonballus]RYP10992.1 hypothetical protein DL766_010081 [Monosporascus sp. MC13-8B]